MAVNGIVRHVWLVTSPCFVVVMTSIVVVVATSIVVRVIVGVVVVVITLLWGHCTVAVVGVRVVWVSRSGLIIFLFPLPILSLSSTYVPYLLSTPPYVINPSPFALSSCTLPITRTRILG